MNNTTISVISSYTAAQKVLRTPELLEMILAEAALESEQGANHDRLEPLETQAKLTSVNRICHDIIESSPLLHTILTAPQSYQYGGPYLGLYWLFRHLGINIEYLTEGDDGWTVVRIFDPVRVCTYTRAIENKKDEHNPALELFLERYGAPNASWRKMPLQRCEERQSLSFHDLEFRVCCHPGVDKPTLYYKYKADLTFGPDASVGEFLDRYIEAMNSTLEKHHIATQKPSLKLDDDDGHIVQQAE